MDGDTLSNPAATGTCTAPGSGSDSVPDPPPPPPPPPPAYQAASVAGFGSGWRLTGHVIFQQLPGGPDDLLGPDGASSQQETSVIQAVAELANVEPERVVLSHEMDSITSRVFFEVHDLTTQQCVDTKDNFHQVLEVQEFEAVLAQLPGFAGGTDIVNELYPQCVSPVCDCPNGTPAVANQCEQTGTTQCEVRLHARRAPRRTSPRRTAHRAAPRRAALDRAAPHRAALHRTALPRSAPPTHRAPRIRSSQGCDSGYRLTTLHTCDAWGGE